MRFTMLTKAQQHDCALKAVTETAASDYTRVFETDIDLVGMTIAKALDEAALRADRARCSVPEGWGGAANQR